MFITGMSETQMLRYYKLFYQHENFHGNLEVQQRTAVKISIQIIIYSVFFTSILIHIKIDSQISNYSLR